MSGRQRSLHRVLLLGDALCRQVSQEQGGRASLRPHPQGITTRSFCYLGGTDQTGTPVLLRLRIVPSGEDRESGS